MDRFTSRRQHSDSNLKRLFPSGNLSSALNYQVGSAKAFISSSNISECNVSPMTLKEANNKELRNSSDKIDSGGTTNKRTFKWRSLFSAHKVGSVTSFEDLGNISINQSKCNEITNKSNSEKNLMDSKNVSMFTKIRLKKSISLNYTLPHTDLLSFGTTRSNTLSPLIEDTNTFSDIFIDDQSKMQDDVKEINPSIKFRSPQKSIKYDRSNELNINENLTNNITHKQKESSRPFSVICSTEHDNLMLKRRNYRIDDESNKKFSEFLRFHKELKDSLNSSDTEDELFLLTNNRNSLLEEKFDTQSMTNCCCTLNKACVKTTADYETNKDIEDNVQSIVTSLDSSLNISCQSEETPVRRSILNDSTSEVIDNEYVFNFSITCPKHRRRRNTSEKQTLIYNNLHELESPPYSASLTLNYNSLNRRRLRRNPNLVSASCLNRRKSFRSPSHTTLKQKRPFSPTYSSPCSVISPMINGAPSTGRIQKRRNMPASRRRNSINVNQVLSAFNSPIQSTIGKNGVNNIDEENKMTEKCSSEEKVSEKASLDAFKAVILHQHSLRKATKTLEGTSTTNNLIWRKMDR